MPMVGLMRSIAQCTMRDTGSRVRALAAALPDDTVARICDFVTVDEAVALYFASPTAFGAFKPSVDVVEALVADSGKALLHQRKRVLTWRRKQRVQQVGQQQQQQWQGRDQVSAVASSVLPRLLLSDDEFEPLVPIKLNLTEVICMGKPYVAELLLTTRYRHEWTEYELARALCAALERSRQCQKLVDTLQLMINWRRCPDLWRQPLLGAAVSAAAKQSDTELLDRILITMPGVTDRGLEQHQRRGVHGLSPLVAAASSGNVDIVRSLLAQGRHWCAWASVQQAFKAACAHGHIDVVRELLDADKRGQAQTLSDDVGQLETSAGLYKGGQRPIRRSRVVRNALDHGDAWKRPEMDGSDDDEDAAITDDEDWFVEWHSFPSKSLRQPSQIHAGTLTDRGEDDGDHRLLTISLDQESVVDSCAIAAAHGHADVLQLLVQRHSRLLRPILARDNAEDSILEACLHGHNNVVQLLLPVTSTSKLRVQRVLSITAAAGHVDVLQTLLCHAPLHFMIEDALIEACSNGQHETAALLLKQDPQLQPLRHAGLSLQMAASRGASSLIRLLLSDSRVEVAPNVLSLALAEAAREGHVDTVRLLLADPRVSLADGMALDEATYNGNVDVVRELLTVDCLDPTTLGVAVLTAVRQGRAAAMNVLLADPRTVLARDAFVRLECLPRMRVRGDHVAMLCDLFASPLVDAAAHDHQLLLLAARHSRHDIVRALRATVYKHEWPQSVIQSARAIAREQLAMSERWVRDFDQRRSHEMAAFKRAQRLHRQRKLVDDTLAPAVALSA